MILNWFLIDSKQNSNIHTEQNWDSLAKFPSKDSENVILLRQQEIKSLKGI